MATDDKRESAALLLTFADEWEYCTPVEKCILILYQMKLRGLRNPKIRPLIEWAENVYKSAILIQSRIGDLLEGKTLAKKAAILFVCLILSAAVIFVASSSWQLALFLGLVVALPLGIWIGKQL